MWRAESRESGWGLDAEIRGQRERQLRGAYLVYLQESPSNTTNNLT